MATFERAIVTGPTPFDYYEQLRAVREARPRRLEGRRASCRPSTRRPAEGAKAHPMSDSAKRGRDLFFSDKANCTACHVGAI